MRKRNDNAGTDDHPNRREVLGGLVLGLAGVPTGAGRGAAIEEARRRLDALLVAWDLEDSLDFIDDDATEEELDYLDDVTSRRMDAEGDAAAAVCVALGGRDLVGSDGAWFAAVYKNRLFVFQSEGVRYKIVPGREGEVPLVGLREVIPGSVITGMEASVEVIRMADVIEL
jgi:hypothetical protein